MNVSSLIEQKLKNISLKNYPNEACALVFSSGSVEEITNISETPKDSFRLDSAEYLKAVLKFPNETFTIWHSHTRKACSWQDIRTPSEADIGFSLDNKVSILISGYDGQEYYSSVKFPKELEPDYAFLGRPYIAGIYDCGTLCRDYFLKEHEVVLHYKFWPKYLSPANWPVAVESFLKENYFYQIEQKDLKKDCIVCINYFHQHNAHGLLVTSNNLDLLDQRDVSYVPDWENIQPIASSFWAWDKEKFLKENL